MNKKDVKRIKEVFRNRRNSLIHLAGLIALENETDNIDKELEDINGDLNALYYLEQDILGVSNES